ncbi:hypothetical protein FXF51_28700 [Nonomuraea sp. PA05]|uniref:hypothetical protein n=1 Tax=Nonomuraea sp. PA05 TaxID=2604466 RepID=UPI0011D6868D|nr:hypothetical protein [Nonomuraea sp. PA05]TYB61433.1 hypothetical protein FXF51_28700 [Nonomuraea sp. PA05]
MSTPESVTESRSLNVPLRGLVAIERLGDKLPHPFWLFVVLSVLLSPVSRGPAAAGVPRVSPKWVTFALAITGMASHMASGAAYVVLVPLGPAAPVP